MEVFCTYAAVKSKKHFEDIPELMVYAATIVKGARDYMVATTGWHMTTILDRRRCVMCNTELRNNWMSNNNNHMPYMHEKLINTRLIQAVAAVERSIDWDWHVVETSV